MIKAIFYHEFLNIYRERIAIIMLVAATAFSLVGFFNGQQRVNEQQATIEKIISDQQQAVKSAQLQMQQRSANNSQKVNWWDDITDVRGYAFYLMVDYAVKSPSMFSPIAIGQSDIYPYFFRMQVDTRQAVLQEKNTEHPLMRYLGQFDLAFFLVFILPLLLITINFNAVAQERERNQLKLLIIQGLKPAHLLLLQLSLRTAFILLPILVITSIWLTANVFALHDGLNLYFLIKLFSVLLLILAYSLFWLALTAWCITQGKSAAHNAIVLVSCWLLLVIAIPMVSNTLVNVVSPLPSRITYIDNLRTATDRIERETEKSLAEFFQDHPDLAHHHSSSSQEYALIKIAKIDAIEKAMRSVDNEFSQQLDAQYNVANRLKWFSPASLLYQALISLSENGLEQQREFINRVESHHRELREFFQKKIITASERGDFNSCETCLRTVTFSEFDKQPRFKMNAPSENQSWSLTTLPMVKIFVINLLLLPLLLAAARKLKNSEVG